MLLHTDDDDVMDDGGTSGTPCVTATTVVDDDIFIRVCVCVCVCVCVGYGYATFFRWVVGRKGPCEGGGVACVLYACRMRVVCERPIHT